MKYDSSRNETPLDGLGHPKAPPVDGKKSEFRKLSVTVPPWIYEVLVDESARRKIAGKPNQLLAGMLREALVEYIAKLRKHAVT